MNRAERKNLGFVSATRQGKQSPTSVNWWESLTLGIANKFNVAVVPRQALLAVITVVAATFMPKAQKLFQGGVQTS